MRLIMEPLFTVVTVCLNSKNTIERTIYSVLKQSFHNYEYLIVDGGSDDGTLEFIKRHYSDFEGRMSFSSEKDDGWYDAMNKAIKLAKGHFIIFLNSDDYFDDDVLSDVAEYIEKNQLGSTDIIYGDSTNIYQNEKGSNLFRPIKAPSKMNLSNKALKNGMCGIRHQSMFTGKEVFKVVGGFDLQYRLHADWDFMIRTLESGVKYHYLSKNVSFYSMYGQSSKPNYKERHELRKSHGLYKGIDLSYIIDRFGIRAFCSKILGEKGCNEFYYLMHKIRMKKI